MMEDRRGGKREIERKRGLKRPCFTLFTDTHASFLDPL